MLAIGLAVLAALLNAVASVLQRWAGRAEPDERAFSIGLLFDLVRQPVWIAGIVAITTGFLTQVVALTLGHIAMVQPLMVAELPFAILLAASVFRLRPRRSEWVAIAALTVGLALFIFCLAPGGGDPLAAPTAAWLVGLGVTAAAVAGAVLWGRSRRHEQRAALLGIATGVAFGLIAALASAVGAAYRNGLAGVFASWQTYAVIVSGPAAFFLLQNALQAGRLVASQPGLTLANPIVSVGWGIGVFGEQVRGGGWIASSLLGAALIAAGTVLLARSPLLAHDRSGTEVSPERGDRSRRSPT